MPHVRSATLLLVLTLCVLPALTLTGCNRDPAKTNQTLHEAATAGNLARVEALLAADTPVDGRDADDDTPLHAAVKGRRAAIVRLLLDRGADPLLADGRNRRPLDMCGGNLRLEAMLRKAIDAGPSPEIPEPLGAERIAAMDDDAIQLAMGANSRARTFARKTGKDDLQKRLMADWRLLLTRAKELKGWEAPQ